MPMNPISAPHPFFQKSDFEILEKMEGFPQATVDKALQFRTDRDFAHLEVLILGAIAMYRPKNCTQPLEALPPETRLGEDLGMDSLSLIEMAFMFEELFSVPIDIREASQIRTLGHLYEFFQTKLSQTAPETTTGDSL